MLTLHHLNRSRSQRVLWLLEELEIPYEIVLHERDAKTFLAPPSLATIHPLGKSPVIVDGEHTIAESGAIIEYLVDQHGGGRLVPKPGTPEALRYRYFMHYAEGSLMPPLLVRFICSRVKSAPLPFFIKPVAKKIAEGVSQQFVDPNVRRHVAFLDAELGDRTWLAGDELTAADIQMSYPMEMLLARAPDAVGDGPIKAYVERIRARPAYRRALEKGGPVEPD